MDLWLNYLVFLFLSFLFLAFDWRGTIWKLEDWSKLIFSWYMYLNITNSVDVVIMTTSVFSRFDDSWVGYFVWLFVRVRFFEYFTSTIVQTKWQTSGFLFILLQALIQPLKNIHTNFLLSSLHFLHFLLLYLSQFCVIPLNQTKA